MGERIVVIQMIYEGIMVFALYAIEDRCISSIPSIIL